MTAEQNQIKDRRSYSSWRALVNWRVFVLALAYFGSSAGLYTVGIWAPLMVKEFGYSNFNVGLLVAAPNLVAVIGMVLWSKNSDRLGERYWHAALACLIAAAGMAMVARAGASIGIAIVGLSLAAFGVSAAKPPLWSLPTKFFAGAGAAASIGLINSLGTMGGFVGPYLLGTSKGATGNFNRGLYYVCGSLVISAATILVLRWVANRNTGLNQLRETY